MNKLRSRITTNSAQKSARRSTPAKDQVLRNVIINLGRVALGCGYSADQLTAIARTHWHELPVKPPRSDVAEMAAFRDAPHVLTHWFREPQYLDADGLPLPLAMSGRGPTIEALVKRVNPDLDTARVVRHLLRYGGLRRRGKKWQPIAPRITYRGDPLAIHRHALLVLDGMLQTVAHNVKSRGKDPGWYESVAENASFPAAEAEAFNRRVIRTGRQFLQNLDGEMKRREVAGIVKRRTHRVGVGVYFFNAASNGTAAPRLSVRRRKAQN